eukprot:69539-Rhodomonas_salina.1
MGARHPQMGTVQLLASATAVHVRTAASSGWHCTRRWERCILLWEQSLHKWRHCCQEWEQRQHKWRQNSRYLLRSSCPRR